jgi:hypothetical protein
MSRKQYRPGEVIGNLREADALPGQGSKVGAVPTSPTGSTRKGPSIGPFQHWYARQDL